MNQRPGIARIRSGRSRCPHRSLSVGLVLALAGHLAGCDGPRSLELTGEEIRRRLPGEVVELLPTGSILCHDEEAQGGAYHLWILRKPGGTWLAFPGRKRVEHHSMPTSALETILRSKLPSLDRGQPVERRCRYTHWPAKDGAEIQVREIITDQGWFASVERVRF